jgi:hypothetical protein
MIPQVPGSIKRSHSIDGVMESVVKSKKYVVPLAVWNPGVAAGLVVAYLTDGRFTVPKDATVEIIPGGTVTTSVESESGTVSGALPEATPGALQTRRPLPPPPAGPQ